MIRGSAGGDFAVVDGCGAFVVVVDASLASDVQLGLCTHIHSHNLYTHRTQILFVFMFQTKSYLTREVNVCTIGKFEHVRRRARRHVAGVIDRV
jgi:hypothetical protein